MRLFGPKKKIPTPAESIGKLRDTLDLLEKREDFLQKKIDKEIAFARANATKNRRAAMMALKRKKTYEAQIAKLSGARMTIEQQLMAIEGATVSLEAMNAMKAGAAAMKSIHGEMNIDTVDDTMDSIREQMDIHNEISDAIAQPLGDPLDEDGLEAELAELEAENIDQQLNQLNAPLSAVSPIKLPTAPTTLPASVRAQPVALRSEEDEFAALERSMAFS